jgi:hypothetical protein
MDGHRIGSGEDGRSRNNRSMQDREGFGSENHTRPMGALSVMYAGFAVQVFFIISRSQR